MRGGRLIERFFDAAYIQRWNDLIRPLDFTELDKQAHKIIIAFVIAKHEEQDRGIELKWDEIVHGCFFEFLQRIILTDIKPAVFDKIMEDKGKELNEWVLKNWEKDLNEFKSGLYEDFKAYLINPPSSNTERRILKAAHYLSTSWEFNIIYHTNPGIYGIKKTKEEIENRLEDYFDFIGVQKISLKKKSFDFIDLCGQLRFQKRWIQTPRIPQTSVLGHTLIVALITYLCSREKGLSGERLSNNFFGALFHDLPEALTRDIISPIKKAVGGLEDIIGDYEKNLVKEKMLPLLPQQWHAEMRFFLEEPFKNRVMSEDGKVKIVDNEKMNDILENDPAYPLRIDGEVIEACDHLAAFLEAAISIKHGVSSRHLEEGKKKLAENYKGKVINGLNFGELFGYFLQDDLL